MKFYIAVEEIRSTVIEVDAESLNDAINKAENAYYENEICLDNIKYIVDGTLFNDETAEWEQSIKLGYKPDFQKIK